MLPQTFSDGNVVFDSFVDPRATDYKNIGASEVIELDILSVFMLLGDTFFFSVAKELEVPPELLDFKFRILKLKGWQIESPILANSNFLKNLSDRGEDT